jgi:aminopeptidase N
MAKTAKPHEIHLKDYTPSNFLIENAFLHFDLHPEYTIVKSILKFYRNPESRADNTLTLNGEELQLRTILIDGKILDQDRYQVNSHSLTIPDVPDNFVLETEVLIKPGENKALSGLYQSKGNYCTQCEAQGFRRITYFLDRPDILTHFTTTIAADKQRYPVLLSNGNLVDTKDLDGRHWVMWEDPSLKPSYLFALVAGDYEWHEDVFTTMSGRNILLRVYVEKGKLEQSNFAMESLKKAMRWDEKTYGREYDLDMYMIVAVSDFNMGAMENKGLNIFNDRYILAKPDTATDDDYINVESVIGHEYFHNWSGNRVTVRDWFQITLKEGLTIFRDQNFTADMTSHAVKRIKDVNIIRNAQFPQDAGPMAHPIRPESYIEVNNFYTVTVYNKGAEVIRMMETLLGKPTFRKAMDIYFETNDGKSVTTEDFVQAMESASGMDLTQFKRWYQQAGTTQVEAHGKYNKGAQTFTLTLKQSCPPTPSQPHKENLVIPIRMALLDEEGNEISLYLKDDPSPYHGTVKVLPLKDTEQTFTFEKVSKTPLPSLLRNFSAPVKLHYPYTNEELIFLMSHDTDGFNSWDAGQQLMTKLIIQEVKNYQPNQEPKISQNFIEAFRTILNNKKLDKLLVAEMLGFPSESYLLEMMTGTDIIQIYTVRNKIRKYLASQLKDEFLHVYSENNAKKFSLDKMAMGERRIKNLALAYLLLLKDQSNLDLAMRQFKDATNLTDAIGSLAPLTNIDCKERKATLEAFYDKYQKEPLVIDKWFTLQAISTLPGTFEEVKSLMSHPQFDLKNPNKTRSLIGAFSQFNYPGFHDISGEPYAFLADMVLTIDAFNPQLAARLLDPLIRWQKYDKNRQNLMREELERISNVPKLSNDVYEIVTKSLAKS